MAWRRSVRMASSPWHSKSLWASSMLTSDQGIVEDAVSLQLLHPPLIAQGDEMGHGLGDGYPLVQGSQLLPGHPASIPGDEGRDVPGGEGTVSHGLEHRLLALLMVVQYLGDATPEVGEGMLVGGEHQAHLQVFQLLQGSNIVPQGVVPRLGVVADIGGDDGKDVVAGEEELLFWRIEADMARGVARGPHHLQGEAVAP